MADSPVTRPTTEEIAQDAVDDALEWAADIAETVEEHYNLAAMRLRWQPDALALLDQQRLLAQTVPGVH